MVVGSGTAAPKTMSQTSWLTCIHNQSAPAHLAGFSIERLLRFVTLLGSDIEITVIEKARRYR
jgi:hypothetical protein